MTNARDLAGASVFAGKGTGRPPARQIFWAVRRQREQARSFTVRPFCSTVIGCRFGIQRRSARFRFIPTDCGFQPVIGRLPQMSHTRAIGISMHERTGAGRRSEPMLARYDRSMQSVAA